MLFIAAAVLGLMFSRLGAPRRNFRVVGFVNIWIAVPGIFLIVYLTRGFLVEDIGVSIFSAALTFILIGLLVLATRGMVKEFRGSVILNGAFVNAINLPLPILQVLTGNYSYAVTFATTMTVIQILAAAIFQGYLRTSSGCGGGVSFARLVPPLSFATGVVLHYTVWPIAATSVVVGDTDVIVNFLIAIIFVYFGLSFGASLITSSSQYKLVSRPFLATAMFRLLVGPLLGLVLAIPLGKGSDVYLQMVFLATMPPAITNTVLAAIYGFDGVLTAKATSVLTPINTVEAIALFYILR